MMIHNTLCAPQTCCFAIALCLATAFASACSGHSPDATTKHDVYDEHHEEDGRPTVSPDTPRLDGSTSAKHDAGVANDQPDADDSSPDSGDDGETRDAGVGGGADHGSDAGADENADAALGEARGSELGVNYNGRSRNYEKNDLARIGTTWVRVFVDVTSLQRAGEQAILSNPDLVGFRKIHDDGYKVILNLKYNYRSDDGTDLDFPSDASSQAFKDIRAFTTVLLDSVFTKTDIVVVGNEPFIESDIPDRDEDLVLFYKHMANHVITYNKTHGNIPLYVGAFNNLHDPAWRTQATTGLIAYARNTPGVTGIDLHLHAGSVDEMRSAIVWAKSKLGDEKRLISTEFSLIQYFREQLRKPVASSFARQYGIDETWQVYQYLDYAVRSHRPRQEWVAFLKASPWFERVHMSLTNADIAFDELGLTLATYALAQSQTSIGPATDPWLLNAIYCSQTCELEPSTMTKQFSYPWLASFQARQ